MNTQAGDFYLSNEDADRIAASAGLSASEYDALAKAASLEQQQRNQEAVQKDIDNKMQILANLNAASRRTYKPAPVGFVPMGMTPVEEQVRVPVPASERLGYATKARELQQEIQRNLSEAGMIQGPAITGPLTPTPPVGSEQPKPEAPAQPSANAPVPATEKPQRDPFNEFREIEEKKRDFFGFALSEMKGLPAKYHGEAMKLVKDYWEMTGPKLPPNALLPVQNPLTGDMIQGMAMTPEGKIVELPKTSQETPKELSSVATKRAEEIANADESLSQLDAAISYMSDPKIGRNDKITFGKNFLQRYNIIQSQGPNVLGVDEAKRLGGALESRFLNLSGLINNEQMFGTDLPRFVQQLNDTKMTIQAGRKSSISTLKRISPNTAAYFEGQDSNQQQQSAPGGVLIYNQGTKSFAPAR